MIEKSIKGIVYIFKKYAYLLSCLELDQITTNLIGLSNTDYSHIIAIVEH